MPRGRQFLSPHADRREFLLSLREATNHSWMEGCFRSRYKNNARQSNGFC
jgi:hypothetical protein